MFERQDLTKTSCSVLVIMTGEHKSDIITALCVGDVVSSYSLGLMLSKPVMIPFMPENQVRSSLICSVKAALTKVVSSRLITLFKVINTETDRANDEGKPASFTQSS